MFNFKGTYATFSDRGACVTVLDCKDLSKKLIEIISDPLLAERLGKEAVAIVEENRGAALRTVDQLREILEQAELKEQAT